MSPFSYADKIKTPLLLIHGEADNNTGTFPDPKRAPLQRNQGPGRHGALRVAAARIARLRGARIGPHMFWEMDNWMNKYVKNAPAAKTEH